MIDEEQRKEPGLGSQLKTQNETEEKLVLNAAKLAKQDLFATKRKKTEVLGNF